MLMRGTKRKPCFYKTGLLVSLFFLIVQVNGFSGESGQPSSKPSSFTNPLGMQFIKVLPRSFTMGSPDTETGRHNTETLHVVTISNPFFIQRTEVTQLQWKTIMGQNPSGFDGENRPVENISWRDVQEFIERLNQRDKRVLYRLPTEAEWEYAARGGRKTPYYFGGDVEKLGHYAWYRQNASGQTHPVAQKGPNPLGLYDMHGNVWEWVQDFYGDYPESSAVDPTGPETGHIRVRRGGGWMSTRFSCRSAARSGNAEDYRVFSVGFRLVSEIKD